MKKFAAALVITTGIGISLIPAAGAALIESTDSVTAYTNYPASEVENIACDAADIFGVTWSFNGATPITNARSMPNLSPGDLVTMAWTGNAPECTGEFASLSLKEASQGSFDPTDNQRLQTPYSRELLTGAAGSTTLPIVQTATCFYQLDGTLGRPLFFVGPLGNYYSQSYGVPRSDERSMLLGAKNGAFSPCTPTPSTTVPSTTVPLPTTSTTAQETTTTTGASSTTSTPPGDTTTTAPRVTSTTSASTTSSIPGETTTTRPGSTTSTSAPVFTGTAPPPASATPILATQRADALAATGSSVLVMLLVGALLGTAGLITLATVKLAGRR